jgi:hypothetical protein
MYQNQNNWKSKSKEELLYDKFQNEVTLEISKIICTIDRKISSLSYEKEEKETLYKQSIRIFLKKHWDKYLKSE